MAPKLSSTLDPVIGGKIRTALAWVVVIVQALQGVDLEQSIPMIVLAVIASLTHLTSLGSKES